MDGRGGGGASHGTAAELEAAQGGVERSRFSPGRIAEFKQLAADPEVYEKVRVYCRERRGARGQQRQRNKKMMNVFSILCVCVSERERERKRARGQ